MSTGYKVVDEIDSINFKGNIIPENWYQHIRFKNGEVDAMSILILAEILYWYRSSTIKDEATGRITGYKRRFKADKLQRNYSQIADKFGITKRTATNSIHRLKDLGCISLEFRTIQLQGGLTCSNVLFIEPIPSRIIEISSSHVGKRPLSPLKVIPPTFKGETNTESITENTTDIKAPELENHSSGTSLPESLVANSGRTREVESSSLKMPSLSSGKSQNQDPPTPSCAAPPSQEPPLRPIQGGAPTVSEVLSKPVGSHKDKFKNSTSIWDVERYWQEVLNETGYSGLLPFTKRECGHVKQLMGWLSKAGNKITIQDILSFSLSNWKSLSQTRLKGRLKARPSMTDIFTYRHDILDCLTAYSKKPVEITKTFTRVDDLPPHVVESSNYDLICRLITKNGSISLTYKEVD